MMMAMVRVMVVVTLMWVMMSVSRSWARQTDIREQQHA
jgi:hypothetical protein